MSSLIEDSWTLIYFNLWYGFWLKYMKKNPIWCSWKGADFSDNWEYSSDPTSKLNHTLKSTAGATVKNFTMLSKSSTQNNIYESIYIISTNRKKKKVTHVVIMLVTFLGGKRGGISTIFYFSSQMGLHWHVHFIKICPMTSTPFLPVLFQ